MTKPGPARKANLAVIGGGPGGLYAATAAARRGLAVTLFEKRAIGERIVCGECIFDSLGILAAPEAGLLYEVDNILFVARGSYRLRMKKYRRLWMTDRRRWQEHLAATATAAGVEIRTGVKLTPDGLKTLTGQYDWIIDASGAPSLTSRTYGFTEAYHRQPLLAYQAVVEDDFSHLFPSRTLKVGFLPRIGREFLPGYYWIFPKTARMANVGVVYTRPVTGDFPLRLKGLLREVMKEESLGKARILAKGGGLIPTRVLDRLVYDRIILAGDAAGLTSPLHGGGIDMAVISGTMAAAAAAKGPQAVAGYRRELLSLSRAKSALERILVAKMRELTFEDFDDLLHAAAVNRPGIRTRVGLRHPGLLAAAWRWLKKSPLR
jgi:digeranylgeranylglycerophospholipid reductase